MNVGKLTLVVAALAGAGLAVAAQEKTFLEPGRLELGANAAVLLVLKK